MKTPELQSYTRLPQFTEQTLTFLRHVRTKKMPMKTLALIKCCFLDDTQLRLLHRYVSP